MLHYKESKSKCLCIYLFSCLVLPLSVNCISHLPLSFFMFFLQNPDHTLCVMAKSIHTVIKFRHFWWHLVSKAVYFLNSSYFCGLLVRVKVLIRIYFVCSIYKIWDHSVLYMRGKIFMLEFEFIFKEKLTKGYPNPTLFWSEI